MAILPFMLCFCTKRKAQETLPPIYKTYLHISHTRTNANPKLDSLTEHIDFSQFDMLWLGGDLAWLTSGDLQTMTHIDSIFNIGSPRTFWTLGNHDYTDLNRIEAFTGRPNYYASYHDGITVIVLDTQDSLSQIVGPQFDFLNNVLDTIQFSSHLVVLHHKLIWMYGNDSFEPQIPSVSNAKFGDCSYCINPNNFNVDIYPKLVVAKKKGIEIICIGGDIGHKTKTFEYVTKDSIHFLASGIRAGASNNKALFFTHNVTDQSLTWQYKPLADF